MKIQIASPCKADWEQMPGDERVRFCSECGKNVYNISERRESETLALAAKHQGQLCVRYFQQADGSVVTADAPPVFTRVRRSFLKAMAGLIALPAWAQTAGGTGTVEGVVFDTNGAVIQSADVILSKEFRNVVSMKSDAEGKFSATVEAGEYELAISQKGFRSFKRSVTVSGGKSVAVKVVLEVGSVGGTMSIEPSPIGAIKRLLKAPLSKSKK